ncbi:tripartite tricarboxylate transporter substrate binding protein [Roseomonas terrae]|uniref:Tripartite tricarboxylate transporter substrate binding protein n=1 Tax=Neoroseomonas terrae TaxID=424799 RepID=A0ABS5EMD9_9PROT|nr:tripartite tricarboxylate transporter substrate binding protein [Neoroseomonas terrae]MBR0652196.1 tripartite tricarboxylate transporter substrate binding protein [Neoroseomonas terrae]
MTRAPGDYPPLHTRLQRRSLIGGVVASAAVISSARAQGRGDVVKMIVPYGAGNITDQVARVFLDRHTARTGQQFVVENQPAAGGTLGAFNITQSPADGSVMGMIAAAALTIAPHANKQAVRYDPVTDFMPVGGAYLSSTYLAVNATLPVRTLAELVAYAKARPADNPIFYCSPGNATVPHLNIETICRAFGFTMQHVPYRTSAAANTDLLANRVQVTMDSASITVPHMQTGKLRPLAYSGPARSAEFPDVPTFREAAPDAQMLNAWAAFFFPRGTPPAIVARAADPFRATASDPAFVEKLPLGATPLPLTPAGLTDRIRSENARLGALIATLGLTQD